MPAALVSNATIWAGRRARARRLTGSIVLRAAILAAFALALVPGASAQPATACTEAGLVAEAGTDLPSGLLLAVGRVESGRWDQQLRQVLPWPWVIDVAGQPRFFADKAAAIEATRAVLQSGQRNIDVGCFQISLLHHPSAFSSLDQAFDPAMNARYAADFLDTLHRRYGNWADAVAAYHSADPVLGVPYRNLVFAAWRPSAADTLTLLASPIPSMPVPSVHIWTPGLPGSAPQVIHIGGANATRALPRVISPGP